MESAREYARRAIGKAEDNASAQPPRGAEHCTTLGRRSRVQNGLRHGGFSATGGSGRGSCIGSWNLDRRSHRNLCDQERALQPADGLRGYDRPRIAAGDDHKRGKAPDEPARQVCGEKLVTRISQHRTPPRCCLCAVCHLVHRCPLTCITARVGGEFGKRVGRTFLFIAPGTRGRATRTGPRMALGSRTLRGATDVSGSPLPWVWSRRRTGGPSSFKKALRRIRRSARLGHPVRTGRVCGGIEQTLHAGQEPAIQRQVSIH